jgi:hypothetical protein
MENGHKNYNSLTICKIRLDCMKLIGYYFYPTMRRKFEVYITWRHFTWPLWERFKRGVVTLFEIRSTYRQFLCDTTHKTQNWRLWNWAAMWKDWSNTLDRMWWEKCVANGGLREMWNVSSERWREAAGRFWNTFWNQILMQVSNAGWYIIYIHQGT